jgi:hypothetical protein
VVGCLKNCVLPEHRKSDTCRIGCLKLWCYFKPNGFCRMVQIGHILTAGTRIDSARMSMRWTAFWTRLRRIESLGRTSRLSHCLQITSDEIEVMMVMCCPLLQWTRDEVDDARADMRMCEDSWFCGPTPYIHTKSLWSSQRARTP